MRITIEVDERAFLHPKTREDIERDLLEAARIYWLARKEIDPAHAQDVLRPSPKNLIDVLLSAPAIDEDADFARIHDLGRPAIEWDR